MGGFFLFMAFLGGGNATTVVSLIIATRTATGRDTSHTVTGRGTTRSGGRA